MLLPGGEEHLAVQLQQAVLQAVPQAHAGLLRPVAALVGAEVEDRPAVVDDDQQAVRQFGDARAVGLRGAEHARGAPGAAQVRALAQQQPAPRAHVAVELVVNAQEPPVVRQAQVREAQVMTLAAVDDHVPVGCGVQARHGALRGVRKSLEAL
jgi:hypothetical protein